LLTLFGLVCTSLFTGCKLNKKSGRKAPIFF